MVGREMDKFGWFNRSILLGRSDDGVAVNLSGSTKWYIPFRSKKEKENEK